MLYLVLALILSTLLSLAVYARLTVGWCRSKTCLVGKTVIVTGANTGIGFETALDFAKRGARVILACRNREKAEVAREKIVNQTDNSNVIVELIDLSCFDSVRAFAKKINQTEERLDILVNNAGMGEISCKRTKDGLIRTIQINYLSAFLLTNLLIGLMKKTKKGRIVNVASSFAIFAYDSDIDKIVGILEKRWFYKLFVYSYSKLGLILFTIELARRLEGTGIAAYSLHPGAASTEVFRYLNAFWRFIINCLEFLYLKTCEEGAQTTIYCSLQKGIERFSGDYFSECQRRSQFRTAAVSNDKFSKLWEVTKDIVQLKPEESLL